MLFVRFALIRQYTFNPNQSGNSVTGQLLRYRSIAIQGKFNPPVPTLSIYDQNSSNFAVIQFAIAGQVQFKC